MVGRQVGGEDVGGGVARGEMHDQVLPTQSAAHAQSLFLTLKEQWRKLAGTP